MNNETDRIRFHFLVPPFHFSGRSGLKTFLVKRLKKEGKKIDAINYIFCDDAYLLEINRQYLNHDTYTDIVTFELSPKDQPLLSDIYISVERVKENASRLGPSFKNELHRVIFHGMLHLCGYKDKSVEQAELMRNKEEEWLKQYFVSRETKGLKD
jgi:probable rRNA maturation factor